MQLDRRLLRRLARLFHSERHRSSGIDNLKPGNEEFPEPTLPAEWSAERGLVERFFLGGGELGKLQSQSHWRELRVHFNRLIEQSVLGQDPEFAAVVKQTLGPRPIPGRSPVDPNGDLDTKLIKRCGDLGGIAPHALWDLDRETLFLNRDGQKGREGVYAKAFGLVLEDLDTAHFDLALDREEANLRDAARQVLPIGSRKRKFRYLDENGRPLREILMEEVEAGLSSGLSWGEVEQNYLRRPVWRSPPLNPESDLPVGVYLTVEDTLVPQRRGPPNSLSGAEWRMIFLLQGSAFGLSLNAASGIASDLLCWYLNVPNTYDSLRKRAERAGFR
jgi:hypothetical protein